MNGEQPLLVDLRTLPSASDACLVCTNMRFMNGKKPSFTDAIDSLLHDETVLGYSFEGTRYDCGSKLGYLEANVMYGLKHPETAADFARFLDQLSRRAAA